MSVALAPSHVAGHQQNENDGMMPTASAAPFALQLRDAVASSTERERRAMAFDFHAQLKQEGAASNPAPPSGNGDATHASPYKQMRLEMQRLKEALQVMRIEKDNEIAFLKDQLASLSSRQSVTKETAADSRNGNNAPRLVPWMHSITEQGGIQTTRLDRHASLKSVQAIAELHATPTASALLSSPAPALAERMAAAFLNPVLSLPYLHSIQFGADLVELSAQASALFESEARCLSLESPVYVFGDVHGNLADLSFFSSHLWRFGFGLTAGSFLFLGDYVDRGLSSLECVAYLFVHKLLNPKKVFLLRGNHETRAVNGLENYYGSGSFLAQCRQRFGHDEGYIVWHQINHAFDRLPLAATIDDSVFCVHGGIPRALPGAAVDGETLLESIRRLPTTAPMDVLDKRFYDANPALRMVSDMLWGDPAKEEHEAALDPTTGFGKSVQRGGNAVCFGSKAIDDFLHTHRLSYILRAHEATIDGVSVAKSARVLTIFSTSKDHGLGDDASCGCVLVDRERIIPINRSAGQQQIVRRRRSITSLQSPPRPSTAPAPGDRAHSDNFAGSGAVNATATAPSPIDDRMAAPLVPPVQRRRSGSPLVSASASSPAPSPARQRRASQDESDSTDDEDTPSSRQRGGSDAPSAVGRRRSVRLSAAHNDNNQSEDD